MKHYIYRGCLGFVLFAYFFHLNTVQSICYYNSTSLIPRDNITANELVKVVLKKDIPSRIAGRKQLIPYIIHQTNERDEVPSDMAMAIESLVEYNPEYAYRYYNETERR
jgi:mannosyltransferase OCH1-like enzyme